ARTHSQELQNSASMAVPPVPITLWPAPITVGCARAPRSADNDVASLATCSWVPDGASGINQGMGSSNQCDVKSTIRTMEPAPSPGLLFARLAIWGSKCGPDFGGGSMLTNYPSAHVPSHGAFDRSLPNSLRPPLPFSLDQRAHVGRSLRERGD